MALYSGHRELPLSFGFSVPSHSSLACDQGILDKDS